MFKTCRMAHHFGYVLGYKRTIMNRKLATGIVVHRGLEHVYRGDDSAGIEAAMDEEFSSQWSAIADNQGAEGYGEAVVTFEKDSALAKAMVFGYPDWAKETGIDDDWDVIGIEESIRVTIPGATHDLPMRLDLTQRNKRNGRIRVRDFKTCKSFPLDMDGYRLGTQNGNYSLGIMAKYNERPTEFSYVFLRKMAPSTNPRSKPPYYEEKIITRTRGELEFRAKEFIRISNEITSGYELYASPDNCCGSWKNDWKSPCLLVHEGLDPEEALISIPGYHKADTYKERYEEMTAK